MSLLKNRNLKYLVTNSADELWGLYVTTIGFQSILPGTNYPPPGHPSAYWFNPGKGRTLHEYQVIYITKGEGVFQSAHSKPVKVGEGNIIFLFPEEWHSYRPSKSIGWDAYWIGFNGDNIHQLVDHHFFSKRHPVMDIGFNEQIVAFYKQAMEVARFQKMAYQPMLAGIAHLLLSFIYYADTNNAFRDKEITSLIDKARMIMRADSGQSQSPEDIAKQLNISYSWFRRVFKQYTGFSPVQYRLEVKVQKAKELLTSTTLPVKEISYELNFESISYFITFFKSKVGVSPSEYRNRTHAGKDGE